MGVTKAGEEEEEETIIAHMESGDAWLFPVVRTPPSAAA
jgi:hypothetical protein